MRAHFFDHDGHALNMFDRIVVDHEDPDAGAFGCLVGRYGKITAFGRERVQLQLDEIIGVAFIHPDALRVVPGPHWAAQRRAS